jgi:flagella basal body P-ring formation protein FlgA
VSSRPLARGDVLGAGDVHAEERDVARLGYGYIADPAQLQGRHLRRPLTAGTVITPGMLTPREVVQRGQQVSLVASTDGILVRAAGVALQTGDRGDLVRVRSLSCDCVVQGRIRAPGIVDAMP